MQKQIIKHEFLGDSYIKAEHDSGLTILLYENKDYSTTYAMFGTQYGSVDTTFKTQHDDDYVTVPDGIAHFLEHKLFESEDMDAFARFAKTGASANAYTTFDRTCYLFSATENVYESLEILLDFVQSPYFTEQTVKKEQGIIGQEIKMTNDDPGWRVLFGMLGSMFHKNSVKVDIAGSIESIAQIDDKLLYRCYNTFYNPANMVFAVAGNFDSDKVLALVDKMIKSKEPIKIEKLTPTEPREVVSDECEILLPVSMPMFHLGFKEVPDETENYIRGQVLSEIAVEAVIGEGTQLYCDLYDSGVINPSFTAEVFAGRGYFINLFEGEANDPRLVRDKICEAFDKVRDSGITEEEFTVAKRAIFGRYVRAFNAPESVAGLLTMMYFSDGDLFDIIDICKDATHQQVNSRLKSQFMREYSTLSIVSPVK